MDHHFRHAARRAVLVLPTKTSVDTEKAAPGEASQACAAEANFFATRAGLIGRFSLFLQKKKRRKIAPGFIVTHTYHTHTHTRCRLAIVLLMHSGDRSVDLRCAFLTISKNPTIHQFFIG
mmetsp:Transcript_78509/g.91794  ORF Transcript_78509/g.91794 Transcript_78509/m.91794 type:complete len:120 (+) Transcript_78509:429-788(+)